MDAADGPCHALHLPCICICAHVCLLQRYVDFVRVGEGSFGSVHKALDTQTGEEVAVKVFHNADEEVCCACIMPSRPCKPCVHDSAEWC